MHDAAHVHGQAQDLPTQERQCDGMHHTGEGDSYEPSSLLRKPNTNDFQAHTVRAFQLCRTPLLVLQLIPRCAPAD